MPNGFRVRGKRCSTCIFGTHSPISPERLAELRECWTIENRAQECHQHTVNDEQVGCAGHYQAGKLGTVHHPVSAIACQFLPTLPLADAYTIFERMSLVQFVEDEPCQPQ